MLNRTKTVTNVKELVLSIARHQKSSTYKAMLSSSFNTNTAICFVDKG